MNLPKNGLTAEQARELFRYDPETGKLSWRVHAGRWGRIPPGTEAGCADGHRYRFVSIDGYKHYVHRIAWLIVTGDWPSDKLDHIDGNGLNNRWDNLRAATSQVNGRNAKQRTDNTSGVTGVSWHKPLGKWKAQIKVNGITLHLGCFDTLSAAVAARKAAEHRHGFHANHGRMGEQTA